MMPIHKLQFTILKYLMLCTLIVHSVAALAQPDVNSRQILTKQAYSSFYLYAGDVLRFEVNGENKKFDLHTGQGYGWSEVTKLKDISTHSISISKDGVYTIGWMAGLFKKTSEVSLIRIPAPGKDSASTKAPEDKNRIKIGDSAIYRGRYSDRHLST
jgi:hypothetical protein